MGLKIGVLGAGLFSSSFIPLFMAHPHVEEVSLAEIVPERLDQVSKKFGITRTFSSFEELCKSDVDAIAIFTQRHLHGPQTLQALRNGKHVYCAVPMAQSLEEIGEIIEQVKQSGLIYMTGETSYYYPSTIYCRNRFEQGDFGAFVYGEAQYIHDMSHGFYSAYQYSGGPDWKRVAGIPPMHYPTHSVSMILSVTGAKAMKVSCMGYADTNEDGVFGKGNNNWDNPFSNETAMVRTSDGGVCRFNEFRRAGWKGKNSVYMSMFGTLGSYEEHANSQAWTTLSGELSDISDLLVCEKPVLTKEDLNLHNDLKRDFYTSMSKVHPFSRLPSEYIGKPNGHWGSHQFLADDFVKSVVTRKLPPNHVWDAAKYCAPGLIAHESALRDGEMMDIPDFGDAPANWERLDPASL